MRLEEGKETPEFWDVLGGKVRHLLLLQLTMNKGPIAKADEVESDEAFERETEKTVNLYQVSDASGWSSLFLA